MPDDRKPESDDLEYVELREGYVPERLRVAGQQNRQPSSAAKQGSTPDKATPETKSKKQQEGSAA